jgi:type I restriction enzyme M protein
LDSDKVSLDLFWLKDKNFIDLENLPEADDLINDIIENIESALRSFKEIKESLISDRL